VPSHSRKIVPDFFNRITCFRNAKSFKFRLCSFNQLQRPAERGFRNMGYWQASLVFLNQLAAGFSFSTPSAPPLTYTFKQSGVWCPPRD